MRFTPHHNSPPQTHHGYFLLPDCVSGFVHVLNGSFVYMNNSACRQENLYLRSSKWERSFRSLISITFPVVLADSLSHSSRFFYRLGSTKILVLAPECPVFLLLVYG